MLSVAGLYEPKKYAPVLPLPLASGQAKPDDGAFIKCTTIPSDEMTIVDVVEDVLDVVVVVKLVVDDVLMVVDVEEVEVVVTVDWYHENIC